MLTSRPGHGRMCSAGHRPLGGTGRRLRLSVLKLATIMSGADTDLAAAGMDKVNTEVRLTERDRRVLIPAPQIGRRRSLSAIGSLHGRLGQRGSGQVRDPVPGLLLDRRLKRIIEVFGHSPVALPCAVRLRPWPGREVAIRWRESVFRFGRRDAVGCNTRGVTAAMRQRSFRSVLVMPIALCAS